jgi:hypothetical protein
MRAMLTAYALNRTRFHRPAAGIVVAMFPVALLSEIIGGSSSFGAGLTAEPTRAVPRLVTAQLAGAQIPQRWSRHPQSPPPLAPAPQCCGPALQTGNRIPLPTDDLHRNGCDDAAAAAAGVVSSA